MAAVPMEYSRAQPSSEARGASMVTKHLEKLQQAKEKAAFEAVTTAFPVAGPAVCALALEEAGHEAEAASALLRRFQAAKAEQLEALQKHRLELARAAAAGQRAGKQDAAAAASGSSSSGGEDDSDGGRRKHRRSRRASQEHARRSKSDRRSKKEKRSREHDTKQPRSKRSKDEGGQAGRISDAQFGRYGILRKSDLATRHGEFQAWVIDVKRANPEALQKWEEEELAAEYIEDYNTGTLPHRKYYNLEAYAREQQNKALKRGDAAGAEKTAFNDEEERRRELISGREDERQQRLQEAYNQLRYTAQDKVEDMKHQELLRIQMQNAYRTGDERTAKALAERLKTDEQRTAEAAARAPPVP